MTPGQQQLQQSGTYRSACPRRQCRSLPAWLHRSCTAASGKEVSTGCKKAVYAQAAGGLVVGMQTACDLQHRGESCCMPCHQLVMFDGFGHRRHNH
jgi:hypothetical protein